MEAPTRDAIETFTRITGESESLALRKLEEHGGNLDAAVNAHFSELERHNTMPPPPVSPQYNFMDTNNQVQVGPRGILPLLSAARSFKPSLLLDPNYRRNLYNQIGASVFPSNDPRYLHTGEFRNSFEQPYHSGLRPAIEDGSGTALSHGPQIHRNVSTDNESQLYGNHAEEEMIQLAIEASKQEDASGIRLPQRQRYLEDDELAHALSLSLKTAEQEKAMREQTIEDQKRRGVCDSGGRVEKTKNGRGKLGSSSLQEGAEEVQEQPTWGGISSKELDEAILLEMALFGEIPKGASIRHAPSLQSAPDNRSTNPNPQHIPSWPSPSLVAQRLLQGQQGGGGYLASLLADREKEFSSSKQAETSSLKEQESENRMLEGEEFERLLASKEASLPQEPAADDEKAINLIVRMPDGSRHGRCFLKSDKLQFLFDFIDVGRAVKPGTYRVVRPFPRRAFSIGESSLSLNEVGLTNKQEALFLELI